jgi:glycosyltransferase involved in cell wall biosynthesis
MDALERRLDALRAEVAHTRTATEALQTELQAARQEVEALRDELDTVKSRAEVDASLPEAFARWKRTHPVPERPLVSVCIATYNRARLLTERCLPSVLEQTYASLEVVVIGDGCTDDTAAAVDRLGDARVRFRNRAERGLYPSDPMRRWMVAGTPAMNDALAEARGDYVTHLDDDDEYLPARLATLVAFAREGAYDFVWHPFWCEDTPGTWRLNEARRFALGHVTTSSVFYRSWFTCIGWDLEAHRLYEPGDWNRFRRIKYIDPAAARCPEALIRHYRERAQ